jgi:hypothetical protein
VGAGGARTDGENGFGPVGLSRGAFSVGSDGGAAGVVVVVVVVVVVEVSGAFCSSFAHAAESPTKAMMAAAPAMAGIRRDVMFFLSVPRLANRTLSMRFVVETLSESRIRAQVIPRFTRRANRQPAGGPACA